MGPYGTRYQEPLCWRRPEEIYLNGVQYLHRSRVSRRWGRKEYPVPGNITWPCSWKHIFSANSNVRSNCDSSVTVWVLLLTLYCNWAHSNTILNKKLQIIYSILQKLAYVVLEFNTRGITCSKYVFFDETKFNIFFAGVEEKFEWSSRNTRSPEVKYTLQLRIFSNLGDIPCCKKFFVFKIIESYEDESKCKNIFHNFRTAGSIISNNFRHK
jgi:hypothetical protein